MKDANSGPTGERRGKIERNFESTHITQMQFWGINSSESQIQKEFV